MGRVLSLRLGPHHYYRKETYTVTVTVSVTRAISAESVQELEDLIFNGETEIEDDLRNADYQIDVISVEDE